MPVCNLERLSVEASESMLQSAINECLALVTPQLDQEGTREVGSGVK